MIYTESQYKIRENNIGKIIWQPEYILISSI